MEISSRKGFFISDELKLFILEKIDSVGHLEVLILLAQDSSRMWTAESVCRELRSNLSLAQSQLDALQKHGFLDRTAAGEFIFKPNREELRNLTKQLMDSFRERRMQVINLIYSKPEERLKDLADAFRLKRGH